MASIKQPENQGILFYLSGIYRRILADSYLVYVSPRLMWGRLNKKAVIFIVGTPNHQNLGDQAIALAAKVFIKSQVSDAIMVNVPMPIIMRSRRDILSIIVKDGDILLGHGGGNMGDTYPGEELCRRKMIQDFPNNKIVIFPQTIYFSDTAKGRKEQQKSTSIYSIHKDLTVIAREETSYKEMRRVFPKNTVLLTPDIVLSLDRSQSAEQRKDVLLCLRADIEGKLTKADRQNINIFCHENFDKITETDTLTALRFFALRSKKRVVENKFNEFKGAKFVITDRLHGMVFSAITGTPCVALTNFNHKVKGTYKWLEHLPYIQFCDDVSKLDRLFRQINIDDVYHYDPAYYSKYWKQIDSAITSDN